MRRFDNWRKIGWNSRIFFNDNMQYKRERGQLVAKHAGISLFN